MKPKLVVILEGGLVRGVWADRECEVTVIDHDIPDKHVLAKKFPIDDDPCLMKIKNDFVRAYVEDSYPLSDLERHCEISFEAYNRVNCGFDAGDVCIPKPLPNL